MSKDTYLSNSRNSIKQAPIKVIGIKSTDCPLSCPMPTQTLWNAHPRVYFAIEETEKATCPYCGAQYKLEIDVEHARTP